MASETERGIHASTTHDKIEHLRELRDQARLGGGSSGNLRNPPFITNPQIPNNTMANTFVPGVSLLLAPSPGPTVVLVHGYGAGHFGVEERLWPVRARVRSTSPIMRSTACTAWVRLRNQRLICLSRTRPSGGWPASHEATRQAFASYMMRGP